MGIISIYGKVNYSITLDPGVWIFDERKVDIDTYFLSINERSDSGTHPSYSLAQHWDREVTEGAQLTREKLYEREALLTQSYAIPFKPFIKHAEPSSTATKLVIEHGDGKETEIPLEEAYSLLLGFSYKGKPLKEDGPVHVYFGDGSNKQQPFKNIKNFRVV